MKFSVRPHLPALITAFPPPSIAVVGGETLCNGFSLVGVLRVPWLKAETEHEVGPSAVRLDDGASSGAQRRFFALGQLPIDGG
jgi:hypothetical protein